MLELLETTFPRKYFVFIQNCLISAQMFIVLFKKAFSFLFQMFTEQTQNMVDKWEFTAVSINWLFHSLTSYSDKMKTEWFFFFHVALMAYIIMYVICNISLKMPFLSNNHRLYLFTLKRSFWYSLSTVLRNYNSGKYYCCLNNSVGESEKNIKICNLWKIRGYDKILMMIMIKISNAVCIHNIWIQLYSPIMYIYQILSY